jgi:hypothetical protein
MAKHKNDFSSVFHRDGSVTFWNVYTQTWQRRDFDRIPDEILATLPWNERGRILRKLGAM